jgi:hypothetical protein
MARPNKELADFRAEIRADLLEIKVDLKEHMSRTSLLEKFQARWSGAFIALTAMATLAGVLASAVKIWEAFR